MIPFSDRSAVTEILRAWPFEGSRIERRRPEKLMTDGVAEYEALEYLGVLVKSIQVLLATSNPAQ